MCLGLSFLFLQKAVFVIAGVSLIVAWRIRTRDEGWPARVASHAGLAAAVIPFGLWLAAHRMVEQYLFLNWKLTIHYRNHFSFLWSTSIVCVTEPIAVAFAVAACAFRPQFAAAASGVPGGGPGRIDLGRPRSVLQYWMPTLPLVAILAGHGLGKLLRATEPFSRFFWS